jgi:hypothetical protein
VAALEKIARPVLTALAARKLKATMPVETSAHGKVSDRRNFTHLEALGRLLTGMAPWLELPADDTAEGRRRQELAGLAVRAIDASTDPASPDRMNFSKGNQPLVDAAFLAHAMLRAPQHLWMSLPESVQRNVIECFKSTRVIQPGNNNWLLFAATIEAFLHTTGTDWVVERVERAIVSHQDWYKGDGVYGDGPAFHWDYYNSFVIHPMLLDVLTVLADQRKDWQALLAPTLNRARRYAAILERLISPEGTYPPLGRSLSYRTGAFQVLGQMALRHQLPETVEPAQVRCALTLVIRRVFSSPGTFDDNGWLTIGLAGHQPFLGEAYISTGSEYLCSAGFLPLGLPVADPFWSAPPRDWTAKRLWSGGEAAIDHAIGN